ncbi:MAG: hypothetical protein JWN46_1274, partial [Acidimicrobiales bacterium]|nr:hypothetical protein [Acidimicrobiales bacterium]
LALGVAVAVAGVIVRTGLLTDAAGRSGGAPVA